MSKFISYCTIWWVIQLEPNSAVVWSIEMSVAAIYDGLQWAASVKKFCMDFHEIFIKRSQSSKEKLIILGDFDKKCCLHFCLRLWFLFLCLSTFLKHLDQTVSLLNKKNQYQNAVFFPHGGIKMQSVLKYCSCPFWILYADVNMKIEKKNYLGFYFWAAINGFCRLFR